MASGVSLGGFAGLTGLSKKCSKMGLGTIGNSPSSINAVSYTHLDVYKRQETGRIVALQSKAY